MSENIKQMPMVALALSTFSVALVFSGMELDFGGFRIIGSKFIKTNCHQNVLLQMGLS